MHLPMRLYGFHSMFTTRIIRKYLHFYIFFAHSIVAFHLFLCNFAAVSGEKSRAVDALAFISHLPKMSGKLIWNKFD